MVDREPRPRKSKKAPGAKISYTCPLGEKNVLVSDPGYDGYTSFRADCPKGGACELLPHGRIEADASLQGSADDPRARARTRRKIAQTIKSDCLEGQGAAAALEGSAEELMKAYRSMLGGEGQGEESALPSDLRDLLNKRGPTLET